MIGRIDGIVERVLLFRLLQAVTDSMRFMCILSF
jgi:hypothetical protein